MKVSHTIGVGAGMKVSHMKVSHTIGVGVGYDSDRKVLMLLLYGGSVTHERVTHDRCCT
jgi:hypothetical protein